MLVVTINTNRLTDHNTVILVASLIYWSDDIFVNTLALGHEYFFCERVGLGFMVSTYITGSVSVVQNPAELIFRLQVLKVLSL